MRAYPTKMALQDEIDVLHALINGLSVPEKYDDHTLVWHPLKCTVNAFKARFTPCISSYR